MKTSHTLPLFCLTLLAATTAFAVDDVPKRPDFNRYTAMLKKSPFAVATAQVAAPPAPNVFKDLYVANVAKTADGALVTVQSAVDRNLKEYLTSKGPNDHGYSISGEIQWSDKPGQTKVPISKDGQFGIIGFNQALIAQPVPAGPPPMPGAAPLPQPVVPAPAYVPPKQMNPGATPQPHMRGLIQRNPSAAGVQQQQQQQQQQPRPVPDSESQ
jgi:hypothetical protein